MPGAIGEAEAPRGVESPVDAAAEPKSAATLGTLLLLSCVIIWGINAVAFKVGIGPGAFDPVMLTGLRFLAVTPCMIAIVAAMRPSALRVPSAADLARYAIYGFVSIALGETMLVFSVQYTSVANMTLLGPGTVALWTALWAVALRDQTLTRLGWIGALVALLGVGLVAAGGHSGGLRFDPQSLVGDGIALARSAIQGGYMLYLTRTLRERSVLTVTVYNVAFGGLWLLPYVLWKAPSVDWANVPAPAWWALFFTVVPTTLYGFMAWNWGMRRVGAVGSANFIYLTPLFAALAAWILVHEPLTADKLIGGAVIVGGIVLLRWDTLVQAGMSVNLPRLPRMPWVNHGRRG